MVRFLFAMAAVAVLSSVLGCRMCAHPYDYCGPRFTGGCGGDCCDPMGRAGSVFACGAGVPSGAEMQAPGGELMPVPEDESSLQMGEQPMATKRPAYRSSRGPTPGQRR